MNMNHRRIDPQIETCVRQVQWFVIRPAFKQTVTTTYCEPNNQKCIDIEQESISIICSQFL